jgi:predicted PurR-regulated permease PerM
MTEDRFRKAFLLTLVIATSVSFLVLIRSFLTTILMAAIFAGLAYPFYARVHRALKGNRPLASGLTLLLVLALVIAPLLGVVGIVVNQAVRVTGSVGPVVKQFVQEPTFFDAQLQRIPGIELFEPYSEQIFVKVGEIVDAVGGFLVASLTSTTRGTVAFVFQFFIFLYAMFFFLMDGPAILRTMLNYLPLTDDDAQQITDRFLSVTRATVKGTIVIGIVQGALAGLAFVAVGIPDSLFWAVVMIVLSTLPIIGGAIVWVPACLILAATGEVWRAVLLAIFCSLIVGSVDNILRPRLVGRDTKMHDLVILFSTLGGILTFGPIGFIVGPILAGLFFTSWGIFAVTYRDVAAGGTQARIGGAGDRRAAPAEPDPPGGL